MTMIATLLLAAIATAGCSPSPDEALLEELSRRQTAQQESLLRQSEDLSAASRELVESDATARRELAEMQSRLQTEFEAERRGIDRQREQLDDERREIAARRHRDPLIATALLQTGTLIVAALPLVLLLLLARSAREEPDEVPLAELLVHDLVADEPRLLPGPHEDRAARPEAAGRLPDDLTHDNLPSHGDLDARSVPALRVAPRRPRRRR